MGSLGLIVNWHIRLYIDNQRVTLRCMKPIKVFKIVRPRSATPRVREVPAVTRAVAILRLLGSSGGATGVKAIAQSLELVPSTCLHILRVLVKEELVKVDPATKRYSLGLGMLPLARDVIRNSGFQSAVQPALDQLSQRYSVVSIGVEVSGLDHMVVVAISKAQLPLRLHVDIGSRFPALISATGRCVAAYTDQPWKEIERRFRQLRWYRTPNFATWRKEVEAVSRKGYSVDKGNYIQGVTVLAVPVLDATSRMTRSIVSIGLTQQIDSATMAELGEDMRLAAESTAANGGLSMYGS